MNYTKKALTTLGGVFLAALLIAALAPKATHGIAAALVLVANTAASPAIVSNMNDPGRIPYQAQVDGSTTANCWGGGCSFAFAPVPAGHRLVILHVSAFIQAEPKSAPARASVEKMTTSGTYIDLSFFLLTVQDTLSGDNEFQFDQQVLNYVDAGETPFVVVNTNIDVASGSGEVASLFGYMLDCTAAPCSAIVTQ